MNRFCMWLAFAAMTVAVPAIASANGEGAEGKDRRASAVPEPTDLALFAAGVVGLIIGRRSSRARRRDDD